MSGNACSPYHWEVGKNHCFLDFFLLKSGGSVFINKFQTSRFFAIEHLRMGGCYFSPPILRRSMANKRDFWSCAYLIKMNKTNMKITQKRIMEYFPLSKTFIKRFVLCFLTLLNVVYVGGTLQTPHF